MDDRVTWWMVVLGIVLILAMSLGIACMLIAGYDWFRKWHYKRNIPDRFKRQLGDEDERSDTGNT